MNHEPMTVKRCLERIGRDPGGPLHFTRREYAELLRDGGEVFGPGGRRPLTEAEISERTAVAAGPLGSWLGCDCVLVDDPAPLEKKPDHTRTPVDPVFARICLVADGARQVLQYDRGDLAASGLAGQQARSLTFSELLLADVEPEALTFFRAHDVVAVEFTLGLTDLGFPDQLLTAGGCTLADVALVEGPGGTSIRYRLDVKRYTGNLFALPSEVVRFGADPRSAYGGVLAALDQFKTVQRCRVGDGPVQEWPVFDGAALLQAIGPERAEALVVSLRAALVASTG